MRVLEEKRTSIVTIGKALGEHARNRDRAITIVKAWNAVEVGQARL